MVYSYFFSIWNSLSSFGDMIISVRRFLARPSAVSLSATGMNSPRPLGCICNGLTLYFSIRIRTTEVARITLRSQLSLNCAV